MLHQEIMAIGERLDAAAEAGFEVLDVVRAPRDHVREALHHREQVLGAMRQFAQGEGEMLLIGTVLGHVAMHCRDSDHAAVRREDRRSADPDRDQMAVLVPAHGFQQNGFAAHGLPIQSALLVMQSFRAYHLQ